jgi:hypothetical protein
MIKQRLPHLTSLGVIKLQGGMGLISEVQIVYCPSTIFCLVAAHPARAKIKLQGSLALTKTSLAGTSFLFYVRWHKNLIVFLMHFNLGFNCGRGPLYWSQIVAVSFIQAKCVRSLLKGQFRILTSPLHLRTTARGRINSLPLKLVEAAGTLSSNNSR